MTFLTEDERAELRAWHKRERDKRICDRIKAMLLYDKGWTKQLESHLQKHTYLYVKDIVAYIKAAWQLSYTVPGVRHWLQRHGFSYKKPALVPGKANEEQQKAWLAEYERLKRDLKGDETICFTDGIHPTQNVQLAYWEDSS